MNMSKIKIAASALVLAGLSTVLVVEHQANTRLTEENTRLRQASAQLDALHEENARLAKLEVDAAELARLRQEQNELLRLRGELTRLRKGLSESQAVQAKAPGSSPTTPEAASPVRTYIAHLAVQVPPHQTLLTGGWKTSEGKRTLVFITPNTLEDSTLGHPQQVDLQSWLIEMPEAVVSRFGWDQIKAEALTSPLTSAI